MPAPSCHDGVAAVAGALKCNGNAAMRSGMPIAPAKLKVIPCKESIEWVRSA